MEYKEVIRTSLAVWRWLRNHPNKIKRDSPYWDLLVYKDGHCLLCECNKRYRDAIRGFNYGCRNCILFRKKVCMNSLDGRENIAYWTHRKAGGHENIRSYFIRWKAANKIVKVLKKEYKNILKVECKRK